LPEILGQILAGVILGPPLLGIVTPSPGLEMLGELGIFFVMFHTGMELDPKELLEHKWPSIAVALGGFIIPFTLGYALTRVFGGTLYQSLFVGIGVSITAIAVQAVILQSMRINRSPIGHIIIGAAIASDILGLITLSTLLSLTKTGSIQLVELLLILLKVIAFFGLTILIGYFIMPKLTRRLTDSGGKTFTFAMLAALVMAYFADLAGLHHIMGAFLAGQFVRKEVMDNDLYKALQDRFYGISYGFLFPIFLVTLSFHLHFPWNPSFFIFSLALIVVAILGKLVGCGLGALPFKYNVREAFIIGLGMNGRGQVELVVATIVLGLSGDLLSNNIINDPLLTRDQFSALILMAFVTTFIASISLKWAVKNTCSPTEKEKICRLWDDPEAMI
jgi:Kef-type K+ transport system membrane component KefB